MTVDVLGWVHIVVRVRVGQSSNYLARQLDTSLGIAT
jgi:hypothetical protein